MKLPLVMGMIATPNCPAGRRAVFYRDAQGLHHPIRPLEYVRTKIFKQPRILAITMLATPQYYRALMQRRDRQICFDGLTLLGRLPREIKKQLFWDHQANFQRLLMEGAFEFIWDPSGQIMVLKLTRELMTGTSYYKPTAITPPTEEDFTLELKPAMGFAKRKPAAAG